MKRVAILGSTGSIGIQTLEVIENLKGEFQVFALSGGRNIQRLLAQALKYRPKIVVAGEGLDLPFLLRELPRETKVVEGVEGLVEISGHSEVDIVVNGLVGSVGIHPTLEAIRKEKRIALANKETIVAFGEIVMKEVEKVGAFHETPLLIPVDSEPSAIFQCLNQQSAIRNMQSAIGNKKSEIGNRKSEIKRIILTASGGPFLRRKSLRNVTVGDALRHPTWKMGKKITVDSATLMNKGFEVIEASWLFHLSPTQIEIVIHPQSIVHSLVEFQDGSILAQMSLPDMKLPIQYALTYPKRIPSPVQSLDLSKVKELKFYPPDFKKFPCIQLAYEALRKGGTLPAVLSASDEVVVESFLNGRIPFFQIPFILKKVMRRHEIIPHPSLEEILKADAWAREEAKKIVSSGRMQ